MYFFLGYCQDLVVTWCWTLHQKYIWILFKKSKEKVTLLRRCWPWREEKQSQTLAQKEQTDLPCSIYGPAILTFLRTTWTDQCCSSSTLCLLLSISQNFCLGWFNCSAPTTISQCFPGRYTVSAPSCQLQCSWLLSAPKNRLVFRAFLPSTSPAQIWHRKASRWTALWERHEASALWRRRCDGSPSCKWCHSPYYAKCLW